MSSTTRDQHSPANMDPAAYQYLGTIYQGPTDFIVMGMVLAGAPAEEIRREVDRYCNRPLMDKVRKASRDGGYYGNWVKKQQCDHCGAWFHYGDVYQHESGELIVVGWQCSEGAFSYEDKQSLDHARMKRTIAGQRKRGEKAAAVRAYLDEVEGLEDALQLGKADGCKEEGILADMRGRLLQYGPPLSEKQVAFAMKLAEQLRSGDTWEKQRERRDAEREERLKGVEGWTEGRQRIEGVVLSVREPDEFAAYPSWKWLVEVEDGRRVWGSVPTAIYEAITSETFEMPHSESALQLAEDAGIDPETVEKPYRHGDPKDLRGRKVAFTAAVQPKDDDRHFAFYKRPTKPELAPREEGA